MAPLSLFCRICPVEQMDLRELLDRVATSIACLSVVIFDRLYIRTHPDWNYFYAYTRVRQACTTATGFQPSWSDSKDRMVGNDQELFARWHFPMSSATR